MRQAEESLFAIASSQQGFFTSRQALTAGYTERAHSYHVKIGDWVREQRGIYRLARFPVSPELWSRDRSGVPQGVFSRQTALSLYELSDLNPAQLHLTVPLSFRHHILPPDLPVLHFADLSETDVEHRQGYRLTKPLRTILDLAQDESESRDHLQQALQQALTRGLITRSEIQRSPDRQRLETLLKGFGT